MAPVALRVNPDVDAKTHAKITTGKSENKFGIDFDRIGEVYARIASEMPNLEIRGLQMHIGSQLTSVDPYVEAVKKVSFSIDWSYNITDRMTVGGRSGLEYFPEDGNYLYTIAQFFPRMCVYDDYEGWQHKQFLGGAEFALAFGDYKVRITVPADHMVGATGVLKNPQEVLTKTAYRAILLLRF